MFSLPFFRFFSNEFICFSAFSNNLSSISSFNTFSTSGVNSSTFFLYLSNISGGIILDLTGLLAFLTISLTNFLSDSQARETETPLRPALAVRPTLKKDYVQIRKIFRAEFPNFFFFVRRPLQGQKSLTNFLCSQ